MARAKAAATSRAVAACAKCRTPERKNRRFSRAICAVGGWTASIFWARSRSAAVDQDAGEQGGRRAEEPPDGHPVQERGRTAGLRAEADAAAVVAGGGQGRPRPPPGR